MSTTTFSDYLEQLEGVLDAQVIAALNSIPKEKQPDLSLLQHFVRNNVPFRLNVKTGDIAVDKNEKGFPASNPKSDTLPNEKMQSREFQQNGQPQLATAPKIKLIRSNSLTELSFGVPLKRMRTITEAPAPSVNAMRKACNTASSSSAHPDIPAPRGKRGRKRKSLLTVNTELAGQVDSAGPPQSSGGRRRNVQTLSPKRYNSKVRKYQPKPPSVDSKGNPLRRSERCVAKRVNAESEKNGKNRLSSEAFAAVIPALLNTTTLDDFQDRDELLIDPEDTQDIDNVLLKGYMNACREKLGVCSYSAFLHFVNQGYDFKKAMETIDDPASLPRKALEGCDGVGIWDKGELVYLTNQLNSKRTAKSIQRLKKNLPNKKYSNFIQAYYDLKKFRCTNGKKTFCCREKINACHRGNANNVISAECANCKDGLWKQKSEIYLNDVPLCTLCRYYYEQYQVMRPNAQVTPMKFDFTNVKCKCNSVSTFVDQTKELGEMLLNICKADRREVGIIKGDMLLKFIEAITTNKLSIGSTFKKFMNNPSIIDQTQKYIVVVRIGSVNLVPYNNALIKADVSTTVSNTATKTMASVKNFQDMIDEVKPAFLNILSIIPKEKHTLPYLVSLFCEQTQMDEEVVENLFGHLLTQVDNHNNIKLPDNATDFSETSSSSDAANTINEADVEFVINQDSVTVKQQLHFNAKSPGAKTSSATITAIRSNSVSVDYDIVVKVEPQEVSYDDALDCYEHNETQGNETVDLTKVKLEPLFTVTPMIYSSDSTNSAGHEVESSGYAINDESADDEIDAIKLEATFSSISETEEEHASDNGESFSDQFVENQDQMRNTSSNQGQTHSDSSGYGKDNVSSCSEDDFDFYTFNHQLRDEWLNEVEQPTKCLSPPPTITYPQNDSFRDTYPDIMFFGTLNDNNKLTADFDYDFQNFYTSMIANLKMEIVPYGNIPEKTHAVEPYDGGLLKFLLTYLENKKNMKVTAELLGTTIPALKSLVDKNYADINTHYAIVEQTLKESKRNRKKVDPSFKDAPPVPTKKLSRSVRLAYARSIKKLRN